MIEAANTPLFLFITGSLSVAFVYYRIKYVKFMNNQSHPN